MFKDKFDFKRDFATRIVEKYGRSLQQSHRTERYVVLCEMVREYASIHWKETKERAAELDAKQMYYFSMEFLMGRLLTNNLMNLGIYNIVKEGLAELDVDLNEMEELESDAALGNGGLGRLAACFLDSLASLSLPGNGISIRYEYGLFKQKIENGYQVEVPDQWLTLGNVWEVRKPKHAVLVPFWGHIDIESDGNGTLRYIHRDAVYVKAIPCDVPIVGRSTDQTNTLRLWTSEPADELPSKINFQQYLMELREITQNVYPDDSNEHGKYLRLKQQYFFVSAGLQALIKAHLRVYPDLKNFADKIVIQLNDTHPILCIPELMRLLMDEHNFAWEDAWNIVSKSIAYTNHTVLSEALERWPIEFVKKLLPRIYMIIEEINRRYVNRIVQETGDRELAYRTSVIKDGQIHMANLGIIGSFSVNGVATLHTEILKNDLFKDFYQLTPEKFNAKVNGITHRRWLVYSNPQLCELLNETIGEDYIYDGKALEKLLDYVDDETIQRRFLAIKNERKDILIDFIKKETGIEVDRNSIFDTLAKRLHAYKRQLLSALHIIYLIQKIRNNPDFKMHKQTFIFAAKAAPGYHFAKRVIKLINTLSDIVEQDPKLKQFIQVVFIPNYRVSVAEILMNASDVSEQISTAGKEASGTGNMKFMMNGAITLGTLDGANVEIDKLVGPDDDIIFGLTVEDIEELRLTYNARELMANNPTINSVVTALVDGSLHPNKDEFKIIYEDLIYKNDEYFVLADFEAYCKAQEEMQRRYQDRLAWARSCLINIAKSGYFYSDRTIQEYADEIWQIKPMS